MFGLFTISICTTIVCCFIYIDGPAIVKNNVIMKYRNFRKINKLVSTNYKGFFTVIYVSICLIIKALWISSIQSMNNTVIQVEGNKYIITYIIKGKIYKMNVKLTRGPRKVLLVYDEKRDDISDIVFPYLGPEENWHGDIYTPKFFNKNEIVFELSNGEERLFKQNDEIKLK
jgi:hypothetical protein